MTTIKFPTTVAITNTYSGEAEFEDNALNISDIKKYYDLFVELCQEDTDKDPKFSFEIGDFEDPWFLAIDRSDDLGHLLH